MAANRPAHGTYQTYVQGNTVRKLAPEQAPVKRTSPNTHTRNDYTVRRNKEKALQIDFPYLVALMIAACCALVLCVNYLHIQSSISARMNNIEVLEQEVESLKIENDALAIRINTYVDLDYVYKVATEELGMVYAKKDQVLLYNRTESEYVRQYEDIPKY